MAQRIIHGGKLIRQSIQVMRRNKKLILLPLIAGIVSLILLSLVLSPLLHFEQSQMLLKKENLHTVIWAYVILLLFFFFVHQIALYFCGALCACIIDYFNGKQTSIKRGLSAANSHLLQLYFWNTFASTAGLLIVIFQTALKKTRFYQNTFSGLRWRIASYFIIPVIMIDKMGPVNSIKKSSSLLRKTWGAHVKTNFGVIPLLIFARFLSLIPLIVGIVMGGHRNILIGTLITIVLILFVSMIGAATQVILATALHRYASEGLIPPEFNEALIKRAFIAIED